VKLERDVDADAIYVHLRNVTYDHGNDLDPERRVDFGTDGLQGLPGHGLRASSTR